MNGKTYLRSILVICLLAITVVMLSAVGPLSAETDAFSLTLNVSPPGSGTATANPGPPYSQNQVVTLTANPATGYVFDRWVLIDDTKWWDAGWDYRVKVTAEAAGYARKNKPAEFNLNFTQLWTSLGTTGTLDPKSIRVVEVDADDDVIDADVPFQFDNAIDYNAASKAAGTLVLIMEGNTAAGATRTYHVYFDKTGKGFTAPVIPAQVVLTEQADQGVGAFKLQTNTGTLFIHKSGGGVSSYNDLNGNDWVSWNSSNSPTGAAGAWRGIPNSAGGSNSGIFHPGNGIMTATVLNQGPVKATLHFLGKKVSGDKERWEGTFEIYPNYTTFTMIKTRESAALAYPFWFLYEGTPGGQLNPTDYIVFSNGTQINANQTRDGDLPDEEWAYVVDPNVGAGRAIFLANHKDDTQNDTYFSDSSQVMTILGFGRSGAGTLLASDTAPRSFTFGLMDETAADNAKPIIYNAYRDLTVTVGAAQSRAGSSLGTQTPVEFTITGEHTITAQFKPAQYSVSVSDSPDGTGMVNKSPDQALYDHGDNITLTAVPTAAGYNFVEWQGDISGSTNPITVPVTKNMVVTAIFAQSFTVTTSSVPPEGGTVTLNPPGPNYAPGAQVTVTATPNSGYTFTNWSGGTLSSTNPNEIITVNSNVTIVANFGLPQYTFNATSGGGGTVDWTPKKDSYASGEQITVTATPSSGFVFSGWSGDLTSNVNPLVFPIAGDTAIVANFTSTTSYTVTVTYPNGGGTVTKSPNQASYPLNATVTLTAIPDSGKRFVEWGGDATGTTLTKQITVTKNMVITATFADDGHPLNITLSPPEGGIVVKDPDQAFYPAGTVVNMTAIANTGYEFAGWSGDATGTAPTTTVTVPAGGADVTATFSALGPYILEVNTAGNGTGEVVILPEKAEYNAGEQVKLTAVPGTDSVFAGWSGAITGTKNPVNITMDGNKTIVATFIMPSGPFSDHFDSCSLAARWGQPIDPLGDATFRVDGSHLLITVPEGPDHNVWNDGNNAPRIMQKADNVDFEYIVKFDSPVTQDAQMQGVLIEQDAQNFIRFDFEFNKELKAYGAAFTGGIAGKKLSVPILNTADAVYMRITRTGNNWTMAYSGNGTDWTVAGSIKGFSLNVTKAGVFAGNVAIKSNPAPAHTARIDYFHNTSGGSLPAERPLLDIITVGGGSVSTNPPLSQLACGQSVTLTAHPGFGWTFGSWSGDATGTQMSISILLTGPKQVTATFNGSPTRYVLIPMIVGQD